MHATDPIAAAEQSVRAALARFNAAAEVGDVAALDALLAAARIYAHSHARYGTPAEQTEKELLELTDLNAEPEFEDATSGIGRVKR